MRDPRVDPKAGDVIRRQETTGMTRTVVQYHSRYQRVLFNERIAYARKSTEFKPHRELSLRQWRNWAASAEVVQCAEVQP